MIEVKKAVSRPESTQSGLIDGTKNPEEYSRCRDCLELRIRDGETELLTSPRHIADMESDFTVVFYRRERSMVAGYAAFETFDSHSVTDVLLHDSDLAETYFNIEGDAIRPGRVRRCEGFDAYTGRGSIVFIDKFELFKDSRGLGCSRGFLNQLVSATRGELLFLHARDEDAACFFEHLGFLDTGIRNGSTREVVLAFHNAEFSIAPF